MHLYNDNSPLPPKGELVHVLCPLPTYKQGLGEHDVGKMFLEYYVHDAVISLVAKYIESRYQGLNLLVPLYADILAEMAGYFSSDTDYICCSLFDEAAMAEDTHPAWAETVLGYFNYDSGLIADAALNMFISLHEVIFYPVMNMINILHESGLTVTPDSYEEQINSICILLEVSQDEFSYARYGDSCYADAPFRSFNPAVRTTAEIGRTQYRSPYPSVYPVVR